MGEEASEPRNDVVEPPNLEADLVVALKQTSACDPELLANLIYKYAGPDLEARRQGLESEVIQLRRPILNTITKIQKLARSVLETPRVPRDVGALEQVIAELIGGPDANSKHVEMARGYLTLLTKITDVQIVADFQEFSEKPELDVTTSRIVLAIADYCSQMGVPFRGEPRSRQADNKSVHIAKSEASLLVTETLQALQIGFKPAEVATHMKKARSVFSA